MPIREVDREWYEKIFQYSNDAIFVLDPAKDRILAANPRACAMLGYSAQELASVPISAVHPDEMPRMLAFTDAVLREGHGWTDELRCRTRHGEQLPAEISAAVIHLDSSPCIVSMVRDVAGRRRAEAALRASEARLSSVLDSAMDAILAVDERLRVTLFNQAAEGMFRCRADAVLGTPLATLISEAFQDLLGISMQEDATVLIVGETGTGKELIARALHQHSRRNDKPMVTVNCAALSPALIESKLFGAREGGLHRCRGTQARTVRVGRSGYALSR